MKKETDMEKDTNAEKLEWLNRVLREEYQVVRVLKENEKGKVLRLRNKKLQKDVLKKEYFGSDEIYRLLSQYQIPGVPMVYDVVSSGNFCMILEEWIDGITVSEILEQGVYKESGVRKIMRFLCDSLSALHSIRIIHRDIKPENVMITSEGEVKLIDFDAAKLYKPYQTKDTVVLGTVGYAAPEQFGFNQSDYRTDIYAMGVLMNVMLTGEHPSVRLYRGKLSKVIERCIRTNPNHRFQSVEELKRKI